MYLGEWGRLLVVGIGCSAVFVAVVIVICFVHPSCWGWEFLERVSKRRRRNKSDDELIRLEGAWKVAKAEQASWLSNTGYITYQTEKNGMKKQGQNSLDRDINLKCAPFAVNPILQKGDPRPSPASLKLKFSYSAFNGNDTMGRLTVHLVEADSLRYREYFGSLEPYIVLDVLNTKWSLSRTERLVQTVQSRVVRHTFNPKFDQTFLFDVKKSELKDWCLRFTLFDKDRLTRSKPIYEKKVFPRDVKGLMTEPEVALTTDLDEVTATTSGELLFGLAYLPTAQRLSISIMKASSLKFQNVVPSINEFYPYVRVLMLNNQGKCLKKKKTSFRAGEDSPVFNETLAFDLPVSSLEHTVFILVLCSKIMGKRSGSEGSITDADPEPGKEPSRDNVLGNIVIGRSVKCSKARDHWMMVMQNPRKVVSVWHCFRYNGRTCFDGSAL